MFGNLMNSISSQVTIETAKTADEVVQKLSARPSAVFISDEALTTDEYKSTWEVVVTYIRGGGTAVIGGTFATFAQWPAMRPFFARAGLSWESGSYTRTTNVLNTKAVSEDLVKHLPKDFDQKALFLKNVGSTAAWYAPCSDVEAPRKFKKVKETSVAFARVGEGNLGYVGDVNMEAATYPIIRAMLGLLI
jgi:hypothetical protein